MDLKLQIKIQLETIDLLQQSERRRLETDDAKTGSASEFVPLSHHIQDKLIHLGTHIVKHETVPDPKHYSPSSSTTSVNGDSYSSYVLGHSPSYSQSRRSSNVRPRKGRPTAQANSPAFSSRAKTVKSQEVRPPELRQEKRRISPRNKRPSSTSSSSPPDPHGLVHSKQPPSSTRADDDFTSARPTNYHLVLDSKRSLEEISGYVETPKGPVSTTALLDVGLNHNLISLVQVQLLGIEIEPPDDGDESLWFQFEKGERTKSCGQVVIRWSQGALKGNAFLVPCWVYDHDIGQLTFGKPFLKKRKH
jgi:hypothetical protein